MATRKFEACGRSHQSLLEADKDGKRANHVPIFRCSTTQALWYVEDAMAGPTKVEIFGQMYSIQGDLDAAYGQELAKYVDEKMHVIARGTATVDMQEEAGPSVVLRDGANHIPARAIVGSQ